LDHHVGGKRGADHITGVGKEGGGSLSINMMMMMKMMKMMMMMVVVTTGKPAANNNNMSCRPQASGGGCPILYYNRYLIFYLEVGTIAKLGEDEMTSNQIHETLIT